MLEEALDAAEQRIARERDMMARLREGALTLDLLGLRETLVELGLDARSHEGDRVGDGQS